MNIDISREANRYGLLALPTPVISPVWGEPEGPHGDRPITNKGEGYLWSHLDPPPAIGASVEIAINKLGPGIVVGYFVEYGFLGVMVRLSDPPDWHVRQTKDGKYPGIAMVFGAELRGGRMVRS